MGTSVIDGTVEAVQLKRKRAGIAIFDTIQFRQNDGTSRTIKKSVSTQAVADQLAPGTAGRFYLFNTFDLKGVHGVRRTDGTAVYGFPGTGNRKLFLIIGVINLAWIALRLATEGDLPLLGVGLVILGVVGYVLMGKGASEAQAQFDNDPGPRG